MRPLLTAALLLAACDGKGSFDIEPGDFEGDAAGECTNRADDDRDGDFDCDDDGCAGSPDCPGGGGGGDTDEDSDAPVDGVRTETFPAMTSNKVDVLLVVDDSASMAEEQTLLAQTLPEILNVLNAAGVDEHFGVVTTDTDTPARNGKLVSAGGYTFVDGATPSSVLATMVQVGTGGSATERGLLAAWRAIEQPTEAIRQANAGFLRDDASLHIVVLSDEEDQSAPDMRRDDFVTWARALRPETLPVTLSAIVGPLPTGCRSRRGDAVPGSIYLGAADALGGRTASICDAEWTTFARELADEVVLAGRASVTLARPPLRATVQVTVTLGPRTWTGLRNEDGAVCESVDCFLFDVTGSTVTFVDWRPPIGATVTVRYEAR